jgi:hypothetical protein
MVIMDNYTASIWVAINSLAVFASFVLKSILLECQDKLSDRGIPEFVSHKETAMAGSSITSILSDGPGMASLASIISSIYISAASFMFSNASCWEYPQLEQPGRAGMDALQRPSSSSIRTTFNTRVFIYKSP